MGAADQSKCVASGMKAPAHSAITADSSMSAELVPMQAIQEKGIRHHPKAVQMEEKVKVSSVMRTSDSEQPCFRGSINWSTEDYLAAHREVVSSGVHNFEGCKISIPTQIRYDRLRKILGEQAIPKEKKCSIA